MACFIFAVSTPSFFTNLIPLYLQTTSFLPTSIMPLLVKFCTLKKGKNKGGWKEERRREGGKEGGRKEK